MLYENDKAKYAISLYNSILNENPQDYQIKASKAKSLIKDGNLLSAYEQYQEILKRFPNSSQARYGVYSLLIRRVVVQTQMTLMKHICVDSMPTMRAFMKQRNVFRQEEYLILRQADNFFKNFPKYPLKRLTYLSKSSIITIQND